MIATDLLGLDDLVEQLVAAALLTPYKIAELRGAFDDLELWPHRHLGSAFDVMGDETVRGLRVHLDGEGLEPVAEAFLRIGVVAVDRAMERVRGALSAVPISGLGVARLRMLAARRRLCVACLDVHRTGAAEQAVERMAEALRDLVDRGRDEADSRTRTVAAREARAKRFGYVPGLALGALRRERGAA